VETADSDFSAAVFREAGTVGWTSMYRAECHARAALFYSNVHVGVVLPPPASQPQQAELLLQGMPGSQAQPPSCPQRLPDYSRRRSCRRTQLARRMPRVDRGVPARRYSPVDKTRTQSVRSTIQPKLQGNGTWRSGSHIMY
jgi:hypothetical protein